jgi:hypothetical protein
MAQLDTLTSEDLQQVIDDLDWATLLVMPMGGNPQHERTVESLKTASAILTRFPEECLKAAKEQPCQQ